MLSTLLPPLRELSYSVTAVAVEIGDWTAALSEAEKRAENRIDTGLALTRRGQLILISSNGTVNLGAFSVDNIGDLLFFFNYLLLDGRMFDNIAEALLTLSRLAQFNGCRVIILVPRDALAEITDAIGPVDNLNGTRH